MQQIINFFIRNKIGLLYVLLLLIAVGFTVQSHSYHQSKLFNSSNWLSGNLYETSSNISAYFSLKETNKQLVEENKKLRHLLFNLKNTDSVVKKDSLASNYSLISGKVVKNSFSLSQNYVTIKAGEKQGVEQDMGAITTKGILGIVEQTSSGFSSVQSILNKKSRINAKLKNSDYFGSLIWDGKEYTTVQLIDIPKLVSLKVGDTIVTGAMSSIFPENIPIGTIKDFNLKQGESSYQVNVILFQDMASVKNVYFIKNNERAEILELEKEIDNAQ